MKRFHFSAEDQTQEALHLLKQVGESMQHPLVVTNYDNTILYANPYFLEFTRDKGPGFLIQSVDQVRDLMPEELVLARVWQTGEPCSVEIVLPLAAGTTIMQCDCIPFMNLNQRVALVTLIYRTTRSSGRSIPEKQRQAETSQSLSGDLRKSCREFGETLDRFSKGFLETTRPPDADDPLAGLKRKYNDGIGHVQKMLTVRGLFD